MNKINIFIILILILITGKSVQAMDFYPEFGVDPFYSSLNPENTLEDAKESDTVWGIIKNKKKIKTQKNNETKIEETKDINIKNDKNEEDVKKEKRNFFIIKKDKKEEKEKILTPAQRAEAANKEEREKEKLKLKEQQIENNFSLRDKLYILKKKEKVGKAIIPDNPAIEITADYMEYYPDRYEIEAVGNAQILFTRDNSSLKANKIVYNYDRNIVRANENVLLQTDESTTEGDFIRLDLSKPNGWIENPITNTEDIKLSAQEALIYSDRIEEHNGAAKILKNEVLRFGSTSFDNYVDQGQIFQNRFMDKKEKIDKGVYGIKAKTIYIDSKKDHEVITIKNADLYLKDKKIASIPSAKIISNKQNTSIETNIPEFGSQSKIGMYLGPAVVLNVPGGSTLKLAPMLTYGKDKLGVGGIARYRNQYNMTEAAYGTSRDEFVLRGRQKIANGLTLDYSRYANQNEWFLGYRMPKYGLNLSYRRSDDVKDLKLKFSQMYSAGLFVDNTLRDNHDFKDAEARFRWMTQTYKPIYNYTSDEGNVGLNLGFVVQTLAAAYTTGDVQGLFRLGPSLRSKVGPWQQSLIFYETASDGKSPFEFDRYRYGRSNLVLIESVKVCKYLSLGYLASAAMDRDIKADKVLQENRILVSIGPDYAKLTLGYDSVRRNTMFVLSMLVGTENSDIEFEKSVLKNPQNFGKKNTKKKNKKKSYKKYLKFDKKKPIQPE